MQNDFKATPNLTFSVGLRYSYFGPLYSKQNNAPGVTFGNGSQKFTNLTVRNMDGLWQPQKANFGPQFGFNYSPRHGNSNLVIRGGYGLNYNQEEIAISANSLFNPGSQVYPTFQYTSPGNPGPSGSKIQYGISSSPTSLYGYAANPNAVSAFNSNGLPTAGAANIVIVGDGYGHLPTTYTEHYSLQTEYQLSKFVIASVGYQGSVSRHLINHQTPNSYAVASGVATESVGNQRRLLA